MLDTKSMGEQAAIAGKTSDGVYSQTFATGNFYIVLSLSGDKTVDKELGRNTLAKIEEMVSQTPDIAPKEVVEIVNDEFQDGIKINLAVAKVQGQKLSISGVGGVSAKLIRQGKIVSLLAKVTDNSPSRVNNQPFQGKQPVSSVSGPVFHGDLLIVGTDDFFGLLSNEDLVGRQDQSVAELRDVLLPKVEGLENNSRIAALLVGVDLISNPPENAAEDQSPLPSETPDSTPPTTRNQSLLPYISQLKNKYLSKIPKPRGLYLKNHYGENASPVSRRSIYLAIVVLIVLVCLIAFQLRSRSIELSIKAVAALAQQVQDGIDSASKLAGVNDVIAREVLLQTRADFVSKAESTFGQNWQKTSDSKLRATLVNLDAKIAAVSHIYAVPQLTIFYDFGLLKSGGKIVSSSLNKNEIFSLDGANGAVYLVGTKNKNASILTGSEDLKSAKYISGLGDNVYLVSPGGITHLDRSTQPTSAKQVVKSSDKWGQLRGLVAFGGNLYLLDVSNNQVWKHQGTEFGFGDVAPYLKSGGLDFSKVTSFAIDGYVYVLSNSGNIVRFASGYGDDAFKLTGLPDPLVSPSSIFTSDETENIYVLDNNGSRVVVLDKKGVYQAQYVLASPLPLAASPSVLADESVKKVFLVSGDKVFSFDLH